MRGDKIVTIEINPENGTFTVDTEGFHGTGCDSIHKAFEAMGKVTKEIKKPEYNERAPNRNVLHVRA